MPWVPTRRPRHPRCGPAARWRHDGSRYEPRSCRCHRYQQLELGTAGTFSPARARPGRSMARCSQSSGRNPRRASMLQGRGPGLHDRGEYLTARRQHTKVQGAGVDLQLVRLRLSVAPARRSDCQSVAHPRRFTANLQRLVDLLQKRRSARADILSADHSFWLFRWNDSFRTSNPTLKSRRETFHLHPLQMRLTGTVLLQVLLPSSNWALPTGLYLRQAKPPILLLGSATSRSRQA